MTFSGSRRAWFALLLGAVVLLLGGGRLIAQEKAPDLLSGAVGYIAVDTFDDVVFNLETAIVNRGLVVDYVSHVGEMLDRTGADVGDGKPVFSNAQTMLFCSAVLSRKVMEADPSGIAYCPYAVFAYSTADEPDTVVVGYRKLPEVGNSANAAREVNLLLDSIVVEASGG